MNLTRSPRSRSSKYGSRKTTRGGIRYDSKLEADYADQLEWRKRAGELLEIRRQWPILLYVNHILVCKFVVDFRIITTDGKAEYHEVKGHPTEAFKLKWQLARALHPDWEWVMVRKNR